MPAHIVQQGECLSLLAKVYGLADWKVIYDAPENADFRAARPDPNLIYPGDEVFIPTPEAKQTTGSTEQNHRFKLTRPRTMLRIRVCGLDREPLANTPYTLTVGTAKMQGTTDAEGILEQLIDARADSGVLKVTLGQDKFLDWPLKLGNLDPVEYLTGVQARLKNLGLDPGPIDGIMGPKTKRAVIAFQTLHPPLDVDGIPGPQTQAKLKEVHGC
ncbi:MAG: peptidoglycan-binding protein [Planctomycetota bacterium]|nr:peptidoglycan-binding protein [Planctomycetota bacterium]